MARELLAVASSAPDPAPLVAAAQALWKKDEDYVVESLPTHETFRGDVEDVAKLELDNRYGRLVMTSLRKFIAEELDRAKAPATLIQKFMGHAPESMTDDRYQRFQLEVMLPRQGEAPP